MAQLLLSSSFCSLKDPLIQVSSNFKNFPSAMKYNPAHVMRGALRHELSYNLTRPYPRDRWYSSKLIVSTLFLVLLVLFTSFNLANSGYDLQPRYTTNPNGIESERCWFNSKWFTFGDDKLNPRCQRLDIPVGYQFMTTNLGLRYTVTAVTQNVNGTVLQRSQLSYLNNTLKDCQVDSIDIHLEKSDRSPPDGYFWSWQTSSTSVSASCYIHDEEDVFKISFVAKSPRLKGYDYVAVSNHTTHASIWWGTRILNNYFFGIRVVVARKLPDDDKKSLEITLADFSFQPGSTDDMTNQGLFKVGWSYLEASGKTLNDGMLAGAGGHNTMMLYNNLTFPLSRPLTEAFFFAKVFRSLVLIDLGNDKPSNLLLDEKLLRYALNPHDDFNREGKAPLALDLDSGRAPWRSVRGIPSPDGKNMSSMDDAYAHFRNMTGPLETKNASIYAQYICSVPEAKGAATAFLFTLVATLALLQTAWMIFKWLTEVAMAHEPMVMYCEGCLSQGHEMFSGPKGGPYRGSENGPDNFPSTVTLLRQENRLDGSDEER
jgi:hypothetical protein